MGQTRALDTDEIHPTGSLVNYALNLAILERSMWWTYVSALDTACKHAVVKGSPAGAVISFTNLILIAAYSVRRTQARNSKTMFAVLTLAVHLGQRCLDE